MSLIPLIKQSVKYPFLHLAAKFGHHRRNASHPRLWIMMYHRILPKTDPRYDLEEPGMIVEPDTFRMHLQVLKQEFSILPLGEWIRRYQEGESLPEKTCAITFDDGWLDNYQYAMSILKDEQVPATLFAVSNMIGTYQEFWPNRVVRLLHQERQKIMSIEWLNRLISDQPVNNEISAQVIYSLKEFSDDRLLTLIEQAEKQLGIDPPKERALMNWDEMYEFGSNDLLDIGSHTCHHFRLRSDLNPDVMRDEIVKSRTQLENKFEHPVELFCYPNGDICDASLKAVSENYRAAVTTEKGINSTNAIDLYKLKRIGVHQHSSDTPTKLLAQIACWP